MTGTRPAHIPDGLAERLRSARRISVLTGAGASAESGVPTFREAQTGLWARYDPMALATPEAFESDPALVWRWYRWRRELVAQVDANPGHRALADLEARSEQLTLITQNVDGLHQRAGSRSVIEFHGNLFTTRCASGCGERPDDGSAVPRCPDCGAGLRPGVVWFGEAIPEAALAAATKAAETCELFLSVGTSSVVFPAGGLLALAKHAGAYCIEVNTQPTGEAVDCVLAGPAGLILPQLAALRMN